MSGSDFAWCVLCGKQGEASQSEWHLLSSFYSPSLECRHAAVKQREERDMEREREGGRGYVMRRQ